VDKYVFSSIGNCCVRPKPCLGELLLPCESDLFLVSSAPPEHGLFHDKRCCASLHRLSPYFFFPYPLNLIFGKLKIAHIDFIFIITGGMSTASLIRFSISLRKFRASRGPKPQNQHPPLMAFCVHELSKIFFSTFHIRQRHDNLPVKPARTQ